jgi:hypothetical protein
MTMRDEFAEWAFATGDAGKHPPSAGDISESGISEGVLVLVVQTG